MFLAESVRESYRVKKLSIVGVLALYTVILLWNRAAAGNTSISTAIWLLSLILQSLMIGDLFVKWALNGENAFNNLPTKLLAGLLILNIFLFASIFFLPFNLTIIWMSLFGLTLVTWLLTQKNNGLWLLSSNDVTGSLLFLIAPLIITLWCSDILHPLSITNQTITIRAWQDIYFHLCEISNFASSAGIKTLSDVQMAHAPVVPYHMATYLLPAVLVHMTACSTLIAYASLLIPLGILLTALAAYSFCNSLFGKWPALAAALGLLLLPDANQQGFGNRFLDYHCLEQISPAQGYGIACASLAFMLLIEGCRKNRFRLILLGELFAGLTLLFKAQIFVAISFPALIIPVLFSQGRIAKYRYPLLLLATCFYASVVVLSQKFSSAPTLSLDGSGLSPYSTLILNNQRPGVFRHFFELLFSHATHHTSLKVIIFALLLICSTFGIFTAVYVFSLRHLKQNFNAIIWSFPILIVFIYLLMACGLAYDTRHIGTPEELLHRPFVWAYFILVIWSVAACYHRFFGNRLPPQKRVRWLFVIGLLMLVNVPLLFSKKIQTYKDWGIDYQTISVCQFQTANFIRQNSLPDEIIQSATNNDFTLSALAERKSYAINTGGVRAPTGIQYRLSELNKLKAITNHNDASTFMKSHGIKWYVVTPQDRVLWAQSKSLHSDYECGDSKTYHF